MDKSVAALSQLLELEKDVVKGALEDDSLVSRITDFTEKNRIQKKDDFEKYEANTKKEARETYYSELVEEAKKGEMNGTLYSAIKGAALQMEEKAIAKKYGIENYKNLNDVIDQVTKSKSGGTDNKELEDEVSELKQANLKLVKERDDAVSEERRKYKTRYLESKLDTSINDLPFDFDGLSAEEKKAAQKSTMEIVRSVFINRYDLGTDDDYSGVTVSDKDGNVVKSEATREPIPVVDVLAKLAKELNMKMKSPEKGGQGGTSSQSSTNMSYNSIDELDAAIAAGKLKPYDEETLKERRRLIKGMKGQ